VGAKTPPRKIDLESLCRGFTEKNVKTLGGFATSPNVAEATKMEAIKLLLAYGHGKPKSPKQEAEITGHINVTIRDIAAELAARKVKLDE
jgi:hypothetical protein